VIKKVRDLLFKKEKGFTLIEIVLVLAIAGLIMVIVFLAVSGAQKSRRDTQRKDDNARVLAQMEQYASNNSGSYPANQAAFATAMTGTYALANANDPLSGTAYNYSTAQVPSTSLSAGFTYTLTGRTVTICMNLEQGTQCLSNN